MCSLRREVNTLHTSTGRAHRETIIVYGVVVCYLEQRVWCVFDVVVMILRSVDVSVVDVTLPQIYFPTYQTFFHL